MVWLVHVWAITSTISPPARPFLRPSAHDLHRALPCGSARTPMLKRESPLGPTSRSPSMTGSLACSIASPPPGTARLKIKGRPVCAILVPASWSRALIDHPTLITYVQVDSTDDRGSRAVLFLNTPAPPGKGASHSANAICWRWSLCRSSRPLHRLLPRPWRTLELNALSARLRAPQPAKWTGSQRVSPHLVEVTIKGKRSMPRPTATSCCLAKPSPLTRTRGRPTSPPPPLRTGVLACSECAVAASRYSQTKPSRPTRQSWDLFVSQALDQSPNHHLRVRIL